jgi:hypothetical protein
MSNNKIYAQVQKCERANGSVNGNPNWLLTVREFDSNGDWTLEARKTSNDLSDSYGEIPNKIYSKMPEVVEVEHELTKAGRIKSIRAL